MPTRRRQGADPAGLWRRREPARLRRGHADAALAGRTRRAATRVVPDPAGFDTYDSCARARSVFGVRRAIVVTSGYHLPRAIALCQHSGIDAFGVGDDSGRADWWSWWTGTAREQPATALAVVDMLVRRTP